MSLRTYNLNDFRRVPQLLRVLAAPAFLVLVLVGWLVALPATQFAQAPHAEPQRSAFRIGEKLSYTVSFGKFSNAAYAEMFVVSRGNLNGRDAVEIRGRVKTLDMVSAAFFLVDEARTVFAAPDTGLPLYISSNSNNTVLPQVKISNYLTQPTSNYDFLTAIYKARETGGAGTFSIYENDQASTVTFLPTTAERVKTDAGEFETVISTVQAPMLTAIGITDVKVNFSTDEARIPVQIRFKTTRGSFRALIAGISLPEPPAPQVTPTPAPTETPAATPTPTPTPEQYINDRPLLPELGFQLGEVLDYGITAAGKPVGRITFRAQERRLFEGNDSLLLTATISAIEPGNGIFFLGDAARSQVDPVSLTPYWSQTRFNSSMTGLKQTVTFDPKTGIINYGGPQAIESPIGTHNLLSLFYAMRSFNLQRSKDPTNHVNDTRVAVFWDDQTFVFTLRPSNPEELTINDEKVEAQLISINTSNPQLDALSIKVWLGAVNRVPVRLSAGIYQADLISRSVNLPK